MKDNKVNRTISATLSANLKFSTIDILDYESLAIELVHASGVAGNFELQQSNSGSYWFTISGSSLAADATNGLFWSVNNINARFLRVAYVGASSGQAVTINVVAKDL
jgi:hypothetical protein